MSIKEEMEYYRDLRRHNKVRLEDIANYCNCSHSYLSLIERGKRNPNVNPGIVRRYKEYIEKQIAELGL
ncbi:helix-turn-helix domain-containing protein [Halobacillus amylolyticus]|uniref:Helix-turn-helix domain-containing protein n=1 Tax=Halobacillus amylolyticus TaxID=2932259 RepID=A0ABY4HC41_9BACI|nr:helix-turn-helix transcriptional regulator [Halobacillus amylolyticus]UOR12184.1 helix-turn-helix domain-containing protein [Halobacillus amylolyticus]